MAKIVLLPGYGSAANYSIFKKYPKEFEFSGFEKLINSNDAVFFQWFKEYNFSFLQTLNPVTHIKLYQTEKKDLFDKKIYKNLDEVLNTEKPEIIVCHSMGSLLLKNYLDNHQSPQSVKKIVLIQADISYKAAFNTDRKIINFFCFWDPSLWLSLFINRYLPAGLFGLKNASKNSFFPLFGFPNIHLSSIKSKKIIKKIEAS